MPVVNLTARFVELAKPVRGSWHSYLDDTVRGLCLCASSGGAKAWFLHFTKPSDGRRARLKLGTYPELGLAAARQKARDARAGIGGGGQTRSPRSVASRRPRSAFVTSSKTTSSDVYRPSGQGTKLPVVCGRTSPR